MPQNASTLFYALHIDAANRDTGQIILSEGEFKKNRRSWAVTFHTQFCALVAIQ